MSPIELFWTAKNIVFGIPTIRMQCFLICSEDQGLRTEDCLFTFLWLASLSLFETKNSSKFLLNLKKPSKPGLQRCAIFATLYCPFDIGM